VSRVLYSVQQRVSGVLQAITPRTTGQPAATALQTALASVRNGGSGATLTTATATTTTRTAYTRQLALNRQLVTADIAMVEQRLAEKVAIQVSSSQPPSVAISILRGLDCVDMTSGMQVAVQELTVAIDGTVLDADLCGNLDLKAAVQTFPQVPLAEGYKALEVELTNLFDLSKGFKFYMEQLVETDDRAMLARAAKSALMEANTGTSNADFIRWLFRYD
jgi:hypothetical protein